MHITYPANHPGSHISCDRNLTSAAKDVGHHACVYTSLWASIADGGGL